jgi:Tol biopolymer transport system component
MRSSRISTLARGCALGLLLTGGSAGGAAGAQIELVSHVDPAASSDTAEGSAPHALVPPSISRDGRYVAFLSVANNLVPGQVDRNTTNGQGSNDVFVYDRVARSVALVSHDAASPATGGNGESGNPVISADGRWVVFPSLATNLVDGLPEDPHGQARLFLYDRVTEAVTLVSSSDALAAAAGTGDGVGASSVAISADGRFIAYSSTAPDLVAGQQDLNQAADVFLYDRAARTTLLVSHAATPTTTVADSASMAPSMSADGRFIAFNRLPLSSPGELGDGEVLLYDRLAGSLTPIAPGDEPTVSADGSSIAFVSVSQRVIPGQVDVNGVQPDVFLYSRATGRIVLVSHAAGRPLTTANELSFFPSPLISADGRYIAFISLATNLVPRQFSRGFALFVYDRTSGAVTLASRRRDSPTASTNGLQTATMSADGRFIAFDTYAVDQVSGQVDLNAGPDVFLFDGKSGKTLLVSSRSGAARNTGNGPSYTPAISADGSQIAFYGTARDLVAGVRDLNDGEDLFLYAVGQRTSAVATLHAPGLASVSADADSFLRALSADGPWVLFEGSAVNLVPGQVDGNGQSDVFLYDHTTRQNLLVSRSSAAAATAGNGPSYQGALSADGRFVAFTSYATNLDPTVTDYIDPGSGQRRFDVFLFDRVTGKTTALSRSGLHPGLTGDFDSQSPAISADGRWIAFSSSATDLAPASSTATGNVYLYDRVAGVLTRTNASITPVANPRPLELSADGRYLLTLDRDNLYNRHDVYLYDRIAGTNTLVSHDPGGARAGVPQGSIPALSADGRFVAFESTRSDLGQQPGTNVNVYLWDREGGGVTLLGSSVPLGRAYQPRRPALSADGRFIVFLSNARTPVPGFDNPNGNDQVVLYDRVAGTSTLVTASSVAAGQASQGGLPAISADGRWIDFTSYALDLLPGVTTDGVYQYDRESGALALVAPGIANAVLASGGQPFAIQSTFSGLVRRDFNGVDNDVFLFSPAP